MRLLIKRKANGIGDWLYCLVAINELVCEHPDVSVYVDFALPLDGPKSQRHLPALVKEAYAASSVKYTEWTGQPVDHVIDHLVYPNDPDVPYLEGTIKRLGHLCGRALEPVRKHPITFAGVWEKSWEPTVCVSPHTKAVTQGKDWGEAKWHELARRLDESDIRVIELAEAGARKIPHTEHCLGSSFMSVVTAITHAHLFVGCENGITVLAGLLEAPLVTFFRRTREMKRLDFFNQRKLVHQMQPDAVADLVKFILQTGVAREP